MSVTTLENVETVISAGGTPVHLITDEVRPDVPFSLLRVETNRKLTEDESERLTGLIDYLWVTVVRGQSLSGFVADGDNSVVVNASSARSFSSKPLVRAEEFVDSLNDFVASGSPVRVTKGRTRLIEGIPNVEVSVWMDNVRTV